MDAREFGIHTKQGGWRLGLLVARNVEKDSRKTVSHEKVSAAEFARTADTSAKTVLQYLKAWNKAAKDGHVPSSLELSPGEEVDLDVDQLPDWSHYYMSYEREQIIKQSREALKRDTVGDWEAGESITKKKAAIVDSYPTVPELLSIVESEIEALMGWRYVLNKADLKRFKQVLIEALEEVENYDPEARKKAPHPVLGEV
jgi:hypothetical protein